MLLRHVIGAALRRIRLDDGLTLREVASSANISMPYLSEIERGRKEPSSEILAGICAALGLTLVDLLNEATGEAMVLDLTSPATVTAIGSVHGSAHGSAHSAVQPGAAAGRSDPSGEVALAVAA